MYYFYVFITSILKSQEHLQADWLSSVRFIQDVH